MKHHTTQYTENAIEKLIPSKTALKPYWICIGHDRLDFPRSSVRFFPLLIRRDVPWLYEPGIILNGEFQVWCSRRFIYKKSMYWYNKTVNVYHCENEQDSILLTPSMILFVVFFSPSKSIFKLYTNTFPNYLNKASISLYLFLLSYNSSINVKSNYMQ